MSLLTILFLIFLILKLVGVIAWSWFIVFLPLIIECLPVILLVLAYIKESIFD